jgi:hypothetical protein
MTAIATATRTPHPPAPTPGRQRQRTARDPLLAAVDDHWHDRAACAARNWRRDHPDGPAHAPDLFWPSSVDDPRALVAREVCRVTCPVREQCLDYAETICEPTDIGGGGGVWGGLAGRERAGLQPGMEVSDLEELSLDDQARAISSKWAAYLPAVILDAWGARP